MPSYTPCGSSTSTATPSSSISVSASPSSVSEHVVKHLSNTGIDGWMLVGLGIGAIVFGVVASLGARTLRGKAMAVAAPLVAAAWIFGANARPAQADPAAPSVVTDLVISSDPSDLSLNTTYTFTEVSEAVFDNPAGCGHVTFHWQHALYGGAFTGTGTATVDPVDLTRARDCTQYEEQYRLIETLSTSSGNVTSTSNVILLAPCQ